MLRLDRSNEGCPIDGSMESVRLGRKGSDPGDQLAGKVEDGSKGREHSSSDFSRLGQGNSLRLGNHKPGNSGQASSSRSIDRGSWVGVCTDCMCVMHPPSSEALFRLGHTPA